MTTQFKVGDLVTIFIQPNSAQMNSHIQMQGLSGYIEEINGEYAQFVELNEQGYGGCGGVPLANLTLENNNVRLQNLKQIKNKNFLRLLKESEDRTKRYNSLQEECLTQAASKAKVTVNQAKLIFDLCKEFIDNWNYSQGL